MKAVVILALCLLCTCTEARFPWQQYASPLRHLLQLQAAPQTAAAQTAADPAAAGATADPAAAAAAPKAFRPGVYVIEDPPPAPKVAPTVAATANTTANVTGPPVPAPGKNLMVVMTVMGQEAKDIYKNQGALKQQVATAAGVGSNQVYFYNQTANMDPKTGVTAMSLVMNIDCADQLECAKAGQTLYNTSSQTRLTDSLARNSISLLPGTFQVYGVNSVGRYKGNDTLFENKALTAPKPAATTVGLDYNSTMARFNTPLTTDTAANGTAAAPGALPLGNFSIPGFTIENTTLPAAQTMMPGLNLTGNNSMMPGFGALPGLEAPVAGQEPAAPAPKNSAGKIGFAAAPLLAAAAAVLLL